MRKAVITQGAKYAFLKRNLKPPPSYDWISGLNLLAFLRLSLVVTQVSMGRATLVGLAWPSPYGYTVLDFADAHGMFKAAVLTALDGRRDYHEDPWIALLESQVETDVHS